MSKILTLGTGFIASHLPYEKYQGRFSINESQIESFINQEKPDVIVNTIGRTGTPNVDQCETIKEETYLTNSVLPAILAASCNKHNIQFINIASGCIFFGQSPNVRISLIENLIDTGWQEIDFGNPKSFYSKTKYAADLMISSLSNVTTLRIRMPISSINTSRNFINKVHGYKQVIDIPNSVTFMDDFVRCVDWVIKEKQFGIFHVTNPEPISAADVMREYQKYIPTHTFSIISEDDLDKITIAKRSNCILNTDKLSNHGFSMTPSKHALEICMEKFVQNFNMYRIDT